MKNYIDKLKEIYSQSEASILVRELYCHITGMTTAQFLADNKKALSAEQSKWMEDAVNRLSMYEPLQHVVGCEIFHGHRFKCDRRALIPRPETEELVDWILDDCKSSAPESILDIGTGTGCIAISLSLALNGAKVYGMDISLDALDLARENAKELKAEVVFLNDNILKAHDHENSYSIIVSNPPYVRECEKADMERNVLDYDPSLALFVSDDDPLIFYRSIAQYGLKNLANGGRLYFEINQYLSTETCDLLRSMGYSDVQLRNDMSGNPRMVRATKE